MALTSLPLLGTGSVLNVGLPVGVNTITGAKCKWQRRGECKPDVRDRRAHATVDHQRIEQLFDRHRVFTRILGEAALANHGRQVFTERFRERNRHVRQRRCGKASRWEQMDRQPRPGIDRREVTATDASGLTSSVQQPFNIVANPTLYARGSVQIDDRALLSEGMNVRTSIRNERCTVISPAPPWMQSAFVALVTLGRHVFRVRDRHRALPRGVHHFIRSSGNELGC